MGLTAILQWDILATPQLLCPGISETHHPLNISTREQGASRFHAPSSSRCPWLLKRQPGRQVYEEVEQIKGTASPQSPCRPGTQTAELSQLFVVSSFVWEAGDSTGLRLRSSSQWPGVRSKSGPSQRWHSWEFFLWPPDPVLRRWHQGYKTGGTPPQAHRAPRGSVSLKPLGPVNPISMALSSGTVEIYFLLHFCRFTKI